jgi:hypothetical protein
VEKIIQDLQGLAQALGGVSDLGEATSRAKADLESVKQMLTQAKAELAETTAGLTRAQVENQRRYELDMFNKQGELKNLTERVEALQAQAKGLTEELRSKGVQMQSIESAMNDARRRLAG